MERPAPRVKYQSLTVPTLLLAVFALLAAASHTLMFVAAALVDSSSLDERTLALFREVRAEAASQMGFFMLGQTLLMLHFFRRAEHNNAARGRAGRITPMFLVVGFFIPLYNLVHRYLVAQQVWWGAGNRGSVHDDDSMPQSAKLWGAWGLVMGVLLMVIRVMALTRRPDAFVINAGLTAVEACVETVLLVLMAKELATRQREQHMQDQPGASVASLMGHVPDRPQR
jgi:hypothetical protein